MPDHDLDHLTYTDEDKSIADIGWRYALINTGDNWLLHHTKERLSWSRAQSLHAAVRAATRD